MTVHDLIAALERFDPAAPAYLGTVYGTFEIKFVEEEFDDRPAGVVLEAGADAPEPPPAAPAGWTTGWYGYATAR